MLRKWMKIDPNTRHQKLAQHVRFQLGFIAVDDVKFSVLVMLFIMYDLPLALGLMVTNQLTFLLLTLPLVLILHIWGIRLLIKQPYGTQYEMIVFMGVYGLLGFISLMIMIQGMSYYGLQVTSPFYYIVINGATLLVVAFTVKYQIDKYSGDPTRERRKRNLVEKGGFLSATPALGLMFAQNAPTSDLFMLILVYFFAIFFLYAGVKFLHRSLFIRMNMEFVNYQPSSAKERKKANKQGIEIK